MKKILKSPWTPPILMGLGGLLLVSGVVSFVDGLAGGRSWGYTLGGLVLMATATKLYRNLPARS